MITPPPSSRRTAVALLVVGLTVLAACGGGGGDDAADVADRAGGAATESSTEPAAFPVTIEHAFGETEIHEEPTRVVAWGWGSADAAIAVGVVPVAIPFQDFGGDQDGVLPWIRDQLDEDGVEIPEVLPNSEEPPFEAIAAARPDVILAAYSGITDTDYELLSQIAPTVAYPDQPWATPWRDVIEIVGTALGRPAQARDVLGGGSIGRSPSRPTPTPSCKAKPPPLCGTPPTPSTSTSRPTPGSPSRSTSASTTPRA